MPNYKDYGTMAYSGYNAKRATYSDKRDLPNFCYSVKYQYIPRYTINPDGTITCYTVYGSVIDCPLDCGPNVDYSIV